MNPVGRKIASGISLWRKLGAEVSFLESSGIKVPKISLFKNSQKVVLLLSGLHLEETSGPLLLLEAKTVFPLIKPLLDKGLGVFIYPVINQFGLRYSPKENPKLLRYDENGFNYNDGWGIAGNKKAKEVALVEKDILEIRKKFRIVFALSLHEDSETPGRGYIYTNRVGEEVRKKLVGEIERGTSPAERATEKDLLEADEPEFAGGKIKNGFCIVDSKDEGSLENWLADKLLIPTVLVEAPFGLDIERRKNFHLVVIRAMANFLA